MSRDRDLPPVVVRGTDAEVLTSDRTSTITLLVDAETTQGRVTSNRTRFEVGNRGAPPHYHAHRAELFFVIDGSLQMLLDDEITVLEKGDLVVVPPNTRHAFRPAPGAGADVLIVFAPGAERFEYYRLLDRLQRGEATPQDLLDTQERFDNHYVDSPEWEAAPR